MIIIDTSVWIDFLRGDEDLKPIFKQILEKRKVIALSAVFGELLQGVRSEREMNIVAGFWKNLPKVDESDLFIKAGKLSYRHHLISEGIGLIDCCILVAALDNNAEIWTLDRKLNKAIDDLG